MVEFPYRLTGLDLVKHWLIPLFISVGLNLAILLSIHWALQTPVYLPTLEIQMIAAKSPQKTKPVEKPPIKKKKAKPKPKKKPVPPKPKVKPKPEIVSPQPEKQVPRVEEPETVEPEADVVEAPVEPPRAEVKAAVIYNPQPLHRLTRNPSDHKLVEPQYPEDERALGREVRVLVSFIITQNGKAVEVEIVKSGGLKFDTAVVKALQQSLFNPGYIQEKPVAVSITRLFEFKLF